MLGAHQKECAEWRLFGEEAVAIQEQSSEILEACEQKVMAEAEGRDAAGVDEEDRGRKRRVFRPYLADLILNFDCMEMFENV